MRFLSALAVLLFVALPSFGAGKKLPNVVVIIADDVGYGDLGCCGA